MSSSRPVRGGTGHGHLDLTGDREVVFCHACSNEWYNDEYGLECPRCESQICEIITPDNDPREIESDLHPHHHDHDHDHPDPDEDDIAVAFPPHGFFGAPDMDRNRPNQNRPVDPNNNNEIFNRFQETLHMIGVLQPPGQGGRPTRQPLGTSPFGPVGGSTQSRTYNTPGGRATFSITTSTMGPRPGMQGGHHFDDADHNMEHNRNFDVIFGNAMGGGHMGGGNMRGPDNGPFEGHLQNLLSLLLGPGMGGIHAFHGDAAYSQEHFDQIISQLMEANPQSNAAPPATEDAIAKLEKKKLDKAMMGENGKAECTICIDDMQLGDEVTVLPCKHWFHGECVVLWLKEHNTCPICRSAIEKREGNGENSDHAGGSGGAQPGTSPGGQATGPRVRAWFGGGSSSQEPSFPTGAHPFSPGGDAGPSGSRYQNRSGRSDEERQARLNAIRNLANPWADPHAPPESPSSSRFRRDSWSPTSPPVGASSARERSPPRPRHDRTNSSSWSSQRSGRSGNNNSGSNSGNNGGSSNPIHWLRDRFGGGGGGSGSGSGGGGNSSSNGSGRRRS